MRVCIAQKHGEKTRSIEIYRLWIAARSANKRGGDIFVLDDRIRMARRNPARPADHKPRVDARVPIRPLAAGKLRPLFGRENHYRIVCLTALRQHVENVADLSDPALRSLRGTWRNHCVSRRVGHIGRQLQRVEIKMLGIAQGPRARAVQKARPRDKRARLDFAPQMRESPQRRTRDWDARTRPQCPAHFQRENCDGGRRASCRTGPPR